MNEQLRRHYVCCTMHKIVNDADVVLPCLTRATRLGLQPAGRGEGAQVRGEGQNRLVFVLKTGALAVRLRGPTLSRILG